ncbi:nucleotide exchange factor GrpE [candidate division KSB1 bacterium]|nr:nucleotide exchange factor GrpE [candidate division KSB1 bacterium]
MEYNKNGNEYINEETVNNTEFDQDSGEVEESKEQEKPDYLDQLQRLQAEFINYKKRVERQQKEWHEYAIRGVITELLPVVDDFDYLFQHNEEQNEELPLEGVKLIYNKLINCLKKLGLENIKTQNEIFDPELHEAVKVEQIENAEHGEILDVWQRGYTFRGKLLRPAKVKVAEVRESQNNDE